MSVLVLLEWWGLTSPSVIHEDMLMDSCCVLGPKLDTYIITSKLR